MEQLFDEMIVDGEIEPRKEELLYNHYIWRRIFTQAGTGQVMQRLKKNSKQHAPAFDDREWPGLSAEAVTPERPKELAKLMDDAVGQLGTDVAAIVDLVRGTIQAALANVNPAAKRKNKMTHFVEPIPIPDIPTAA